MRRFAFLVLVCAAMGWVAVATAHASPVAGPTPSGTGAWGYCNIVIGPDARSAGAACNYGLPAAGAVPTLQVDFGPSGWRSMGTPTSYASGQARWSGVVFPAGLEASKGGARFSYSSGQVLPVSASVRYLADYTAAQFPAYGFASGISGVPVAVPPTTIDNAGVGFDNARSTFPAWVSHGVGVVAVVAVAAGGAFILMRMLRRAGYAGSLDTDSGEHGDLWDDEYGEALDAQTSPFGDDDSASDDGGDDDSLGLNNSDDLDDDDEQELDDGSSDGGIGIADAEVCVSCGTDLSFGWDSDFCPECGGV